MRTKTLIIGSMLAMMGVLAVAVALYAEEIYGKVALVNPAERSLRIQRTLYPTGRIEQLVVAVPNTARLQGLTSFAEIKPGDDVKVDASKGFFSETWTAEALAPAKEPERGEIFYGKITYVDPEEASLRVRTMDRETNRIDEIILDVPAAAKLKGFASLKDLKIGDELKIEAKRGLIPNTAEALALEPGRQPQKGQFLYGKITAIDISESSLTMERRDPDTGNTDEITIVIPDNVQLKGIMTLADLKVGDQIKVEAHKSLFLGPWTANYLEPGVESQSGKAIFGTITSLEVASVLINVRRDNPETGAPEEIAITVPRTAQLRTYGSLTDLKAGEEVRVLASKDLFSNARTAKSVEPSKASQEGEPILEGSVQCVGVNGETLQVQRVNPYSGKMEDFSINVPRTAEIKGVNSISDLKSGDEIRVKASKGMFSDRWVASQIEFDKEAQEAK